MTEYTAHFRLPIPDFNQEPWHDQFRDLCVALDTMAHDTLIGEADDWANSTAYVVGKIVIDTTNGLLYVCAVAHTSPATPATFATYRAANPSHWNQIAQIPLQRGAWQTATTYTVGDFVTNANRYAVCIVSHVSTVFNTDLGAGKWSVLIDFSSLSVGINALTEVTITAAATTDLNLSSATQMLVNGTGVTITSFGVGVELYKIIRFNGANTITHNATSLILLNGENRSTVSGDVMFLRSNNVGNWRELYYWGRATETARGVVELATNTETTTGTDNVRATHPAGVQAHFDKYFPSGTSIIMRQTTPPTGWTKSATHNDKALRVVSGSLADNAVGSSFSTIFGASGLQNTGGTTLSASQIPTHQHNAYVREPDGGGGTPGHNHGTSGSGNGSLIYNVGAGGGIAYVAGANANSNGSVGINLATSNTRINSVDSGFAGAADNLTSGQTGTTGQSHNHPMDIRVQTIDVIVAVRI